MTIKAVDIVGSTATRDNVIQYLVEVTLPEPTSNSFLQVKETLTRMGISVRKEGEPDSLYQTCHILSKRGKYYILHFKSLFMLDGRTNTLTTGDIARQNLIIYLLDDWGLVNIMKHYMISDPVGSMGNIKIIPHKDKADWKLVPKYNIGSRKERK